MKHRHHAIPRVLILCERSGDHCNRLFQSIHFHAFCLERGFVFWNPTLLGMLRPCGLVSPCLGDSINTVLRHLSRFLQICGTGHTWQTQPTLKNKLQFVGGWSYRCESLTNRYRKTFKQFYRLRPQLEAFEADLLATLHSARAAGAVVVGVHIRRGDYKQWKGGQYYFKDEHYKYYIAQIREHYARQRRTCWVVVCSNDPDQPLCGQDQTSRGRWFADQLILQNCDVLVGPPSTFTLWASYIAEIPLLQIESGNQIINLNRAAICNG